VTDRNASTEHLAEPRRHRAAPAIASPADVLALVERAAHLREGLALLERAPLECIAVLLGVEPRAVERVRAALEDPALHGEAVRHFNRCAATRPPEPGAPEIRPPPRDPAALLAAARERAGGLALLLGAAPECAAIAFAVHPDLVHRARELAARAGLAPGSPPAG
jgi:hypothetical protein